MSLSFITENLFKTSDDPIKVYIAFRLMNTFGKVYFQKRPPAYQSSGGFYRQNDRSPVYYPLPAHIVEENLRDRAALREFKQRYIKIMTRSVGRGPAGSSTSAVEEIPERVERVLWSYTEGLKQVVFRNHPWVVSGWTNLSLNYTEMAKGVELLEFLDLSPTLRNAKKLLEIIGVWSCHENVEKRIMHIRDHFPADVLAEAQYLLDNWEMLHDPDERLRRDLRHLRSYAIDREGATEIDDAVSIEFLEDGGGIEKLWIHIADVSRWIRPGSRLSLEGASR